MDEVKCPHCTGLFRNLGDRHWPHGDGGNAELVVTCGHCGVDILLRRVVTVEYEAEPAPDEVENG